MTTQQIIDRWGTLAQFARDVGVPYERAKQWRHRNSIPAKYWQRVIDSAQRREIAGIDLDVLFRASQSASASCGCDRAA